MWTVNIIGTIQDESGVRFKTTFKRRNLKFEFKYAWDCIVTGPQSGAVLSNGKTHILRSSAQGERYYEKLHDATGCGGVTTACGIISSLLLQEQRCTTVFDLPFTLVERQNCGGDIALKLMREDGRVTLWIRESNMTLWRVAEPQFDATNVVEKALKFTGLAARGLGMLNREMLQSLKLDPKASVLTVFNDVHLK